MATANGEIIINPITANDQLTGFDVDLNSARGIGGILFAVQNIAEYCSDPTGILDGGPALYPVPILGLRKSIMASEALAKTDSEGLGYLHIDPATSICGYLALLQSTPHNQLIFRQRLEQLTTSLQPQGEPTQPAIVGAEATIFHPMRRRAIRQATQAYGKAYGRWLEEEGQRWMERMERELSAARGFEAAGIMRGIIASYQPPVGA
jgi:hypothetical protein